MAKLKPAKLELEDGKEIFIGAFEDDWGRVDIAVTDADGNRLDCGTLLEISHEGVTRIPGVASGYGLPLNYRGKIKKAK